MHGVVFTPIFLRQAEREGVDEETLLAIAAAIAANPESGDLIAGTGGARKLRHGVAGRGKSGGLRSIHYFGGGDVPVFLLAIYGKGTKANLSKAERNQLAAILPRIADAYRKRDRR
ncbi:type II toxin-antitoxin system RelE/ParE family toxin [Pelagibacterium sediminicola]|uniref:type II toxin-antitoxin system RelE/ParE family toxin n=1 Tax=Pelagibacterium sediminicola TaxID=2248761 RepID=UPI000E30F8C3|nr:type II toxin-antitoxin system RelE/ParE family toxin [Pelagibacterium sediminicola]